jgi:carbon-monoxide dehydrogenase small subunit
MQVTTTVNGRTVSEDVEPRMLLVHLLRDRLALTGTHIGCETSYCGACTVLVDGRAVKSCTMLAVQADGAEITTIEGLASGDELHPIQEAFSAHHGLQCGFCTPGMILAAVALLADDSNPTDREIRVALDGNLCRCTGYEPIIRAVEDAAARMRGEPPAPPEWETERPRASVAGRE